MTEKERQDIVHYRIARAEETLREVEINATHALWNVCINRLYYAAFYAVSALLIKEKLPTHTHKGVKTLFAQHFIKTKRLSIAQNNLYNLLFDQRQHGDYTDFLDHEAEDVLPLIPAKKEFVHAVKALALEK